MSTVLNQGDLDASTARTVVLQQHLLTFGQEWTDKSEVACCPALSPTSYTCPSLADGDIL